MIWPFFLLHPSLWRQEPRGFVCRLTVHPSAVLREYMNKCWRHNQPASGRHFRFWKIGRKRVSRTPSPIFRSRRWAGRRRHYQNNSASWASCYMSKSAWGIVTKISIIRLQTAGHPGRCVVKLHCGCSVHPGHEQPVCLQAFICEALKPLANGTTAPRLIIQTMEFCRCFVYLSNNCWVTAEAEVCSFPWFYWEEVVSI